MQTSPGVMARDPHHRPTAHNSVSSSMVHPPQVPPCRPQALLGAGQLGTASMLSSGLVCFTSHWSVQALEETQTCRVGHLHFPAVVYHFMGLENFPCDPLNILIFGPKLYHTAFNIGF